MSKSTDPPATSYGTKSWSPDELSNMNDILSKKLGKDTTASRVGAGNSRFTYIESWKGIQLANSIFGFNGWSCSVVDISPDFIEEERGRFSVGVTAVVRITLKDGTFHEDVGYGTAENPKRGLAIEKAKKEAVSDARKRVLRLFGDALGNCLYDKSHLKRIKTSAGNKGDDMLDFNSISSQKVKQESNAVTTSEPLPQVKKESLPLPNKTLSSSPPQNANGRFQPYQRSSPPKPLPNTKPLPQRTIANQQKQLPPPTPTAVVPNGFKQLNPNTQLLPKKSLQVLPTRANFTQFEDVDMAALEAAEQNHFRTTPPSSAAS